MFYGDWQITDLLQSVTGDLRVRDVGESSLGFFPHKLTISVNTTSLLMTENQGLVQIFSSLPALTSYVQNT